MEIIERLRSSYALTGTLMRIVWLNVGVFVALRLTAIAGIFSGHSDLIDRVLPWLELPSSPQLLMSRPWTLVTYMFCQYDLLHIVFNMLWLYWFGTIFRMVCDSRQMLTLYIYGGVAGAIFFMAGYGILPFFHGVSGMLIGSSASVIAIVTAVAILMPHFRMNLLFFGSVSVKWIAIATIILVLIGVTGNNAGGEIAHLGGILTGVLFAILLRRGNDITAPVVRLAVKISNAMRSPRITATPPSPSPGGLTTDERQELDDILDKIKKSGYSALSARERNRLFDVSRKIK